MDTIILANQVKCLECGDAPYSAHRHDFRSCMCGALAVDGGMNYLRRSYKEGAKYMDMSIVVDKSLYNKIDEAIIWANKTGRNNLGLICAIMRAIYHNDYELTKIKDEIILLYKPVSVLGLSTRPSKCLQNANIKYIYELVSKTPMDLIKIKNFGRKSLNEITKTLNSIGLSLEMKME